MNGGLGGFTTPRSSRPVHLSLRTSVSYKRGVFKVYMTSAIKIAARAHTALLPYTEPRKIYDDKFFRAFHSMPKGCYEIKHVTVTAPELKSMHIVHNMG